MKSVAATRSIAARSACMTPVDPISGAAPSRRSRFGLSRPARASCMRDRSISSTSAPEVRGRSQHLKVPVAETAAGIERDFEQSLRRGIRSWHFERDRLGARRVRSASPSAADLAQVHAPHRHHSAQAPSRTRRASTTRRDDDRGARASAASRSGTASRRSRCRGRVRRHGAPQNQTAMPAAAGDSRRRKYARHSAISIAISNHLRGRCFPAFVDEPRKMAIERDRAAIADPGRTHPAPRRSAAPDRGRSRDPCPFSTCSSTDVPGSRRWLVSISAPPADTSISRARCPGRTHAETMRWSSNASRRRAPRRSVSVVSHSCFHLPCPGFELQHARLARFRRRCERRTARRGGRGCRPCRTSPCRARRSWRCCPTPAESGSVPGGVPPASTGGSPGIAPNSTPGN